MFVWYPGRKGVYGGDYNNTVGQNGWCAELAQLAKVDLLRVSLDAISTTARRAATDNLHTHTGGVMCALSKR